MIGGGGGGGGGGEHGSRGRRPHKGEGARGGCRDVPPPARSAKLKLPPFYKVNGKLKRGPLQWHQHTSSITHGTPCSGIIITHALLK